MSLSGEPAVSVIDHHGELRRRTLSADQHAALWAKTLHRGAQGVVEVVAGRRAPDGALTMRSRCDPARFPPAGDIAALVALVGHHRAAGEEVFATPLARREARSGKAGGVLGARCAWVDIDEPAALGRLRAFAPRPHLVVYSGSGGAHAYWRLHPPLDGEDLEATNRTLAAHLGADLSCTDRARIMRVAGSHNHKADRPCRLAYVDLGSRPIAPGRLVDGLADPHPPPPPPSAAQRRRAAAYLEVDAAAQVDPPAYFAVLAGRAVPDGGGHVPCPLPDHREQMASCMVYPSAQRGWRCYGCGRGGTIYDLASLLDGGPWGHDLRGEQFKGVKRAVQQRLGLEPPPPPPRRERATDAARAATGGRP
jgi:hypothetical protein